MIRVIADHLSQVIQTEGLRGRRPWKLSIVKLPWLRKKPCVTAAASV